MGHGVEWGGGEGMELKTLSYRIVFDGSQTI